MAVFMVTSTMKGRMVLKRRWSHITYTCTSSCTLCPRPPSHRDVGLVTPELRELQPRHGGEAHNLGTLSVVPSPAPAPAPAHLEGDLVPHDDLDEALAGGHVPQGLRVVASGPVDVLEATDHISEE